MKEGTFYLAPNLSVFLTFGPRLAQALHKRYWAVVFDRPEATESMQREYAQWGAARESAYLLIQQLFQLTTTTPVVGDQLMQSTPIGERPLPDLCVDKRWLFTLEDPKELQLVYELSSPEIEELEEYQEGDLVEDEV
jgi:hypothetical protein